MFKAYHLADNCAKFWARLKNNGGSGQADNFTELHKSSESASKVHGAGPMAILQRQKGNILLLGALPTLHYLHD
jgi:hypothetical protein